MSSSGFAIACYIAFRVLRPVAVLFDFPMVLFRTQFIIFLFSVLVYLYPTFWVSPFSKIDGSKGE